MTFISKELSYNETDFSAKQPKKEAHTRIQKAHEHQGRTQSNFKTQGQGKKETVSLRIALGETGWKKDDLPFRKTGKYTDSRHILKFSGRASV